jgi:DNA/RNA non-specific endonuclease
MSDFTRRVLCSANSDGEREELVTFDLFPNQIPASEPISSSVRTFFKSVNQEGFDIGHLQARMVGGSGSNLDNFIALNRNLNRGEFKSHEFHIREALRDPATSKVEVKIKLFSMPGAMAPHKIFYDVFKCHRQSGLPKMNFSAWFYNR